MSASPATVTVAPGRTAPVASVTMPVSDAVWPIWARAGNGLHSSAAASSMSNFLFM
jgi:hypothetical protein